jgi:hypothetical protein
MYICRTTSQYLTASTGISSFVVLPNTPNHPDQEFLRIELFFWLRTVWGVKYYLKLVNNDSTQVFSYIGLESRDMYFNNYHCSVYPRSKSSGVPNTKGLDIRLLGLGYRRLVPLLMINVDFSCMITAISDSDAQISPHSLEASAATK